MAEHGAERPGERTRRMLLLLAPAALATAAQLPDAAREKPEERATDVRLPSGKKQVDEILKADHEQNRKESRELTALATAFEAELEKTDRFVLSISLLKKLDEMEKLVRRLRSRLRK